MYYNLCRSTSVLFFYRQKINVIQYNYILSCVYNDRGVFQIRRIAEDRRKRIIEEPRGGKFQIMIASATYAATVRRRINVCITINNNIWLVAGATSVAFPALNFVTVRDPLSLQTGALLPPVKFALTRNLKFFTRKQSRGQCRRHARKKVKES